MKKRKFIIIIVFILLITYSVQKEELDTTIKQNNINDTKSKENNQLITSDYLDKEDLHSIFNTTYGDSLLSRDYNTRIYESSFFKFTSEYPMISFNYNTAMYYLNTDNNEYPSYLKIKASQEIEDLYDFGFTNDMTLADVLRLDSTLQLKKILSAYSDFYQYYVEVSFEEFRYALVSNEVNSEVSSIFVSLNTRNLIDQNYKEIEDLVLKYSKNDCKPLFYSRGDLNSDGFDDIIITSTLKKSNSEEMPYRVSLILLGDDSNYRIYGEVIGLIDSYTGAFGQPIVDVSIDKGSISISQYGGSAWRYNILDNYIYDEVDNKIYLDSIELSSYHNGRPVQDTLKTRIINYEKGIDILDDYTPAIDEIEIFMYVNDSKITYYESGYELYIEELISNYRQQLISRIEALEAEGEFNIKVNTEISNEKVLSLNIYARGNYNDMSKELKEGQFNSYYFDDAYINIDLENQRELDILDYYTVDEIANLLFMRHKEAGNLEAYSIRTEEDIKKVIEDSLKGKSNQMNRFDYCFTDLSIWLVLYLQYENSNITHERESTLVRIDDLIVKSRFYEEWFNGNFQ